MAYPIPAGYNFKIQHKKLSGLYEMPAADVYRDYYGIGYLIHGNRMLITPDQSVFLKASDLTFIDKNQVHRSTFVDDSEYETISIKFTDEAVRELITAIGQDTFDQMFQRIRLSIRPKSRPRIEAIVYEMLEEWNHYNCYSDLVLKSLLNQLFVLCLQEVTHTADEQSVEERRDSILQSALNYIETAFYQNPSLKTTAEHVHVSSSYLSKLFNRKLGCSYSVVLNTQKINHAERLLIHTSHSIVDIAMECGFPNSNYFSDLFHKYVGISPLQYRKTHTP